MQSGSKTDLSFIETNISTGDTTPTYPIQLRVVEKKELPNTISLGNFKDGQFTKLTFAGMNIEPNEPALKLNTLVDKDQYFGLVMIYYSEKAKANEDNAYITFSNGTPKIFNAANTNLCDNETSWWKNYKDGDKYKLRPGMNILQIDETTEISIYKDTHENSSSAVIIGQLDLVYKEKGSTHSINDKIKYYKVNKDSNFEQILTDIAQIDYDHQFYYNLLADNSNVIDLNELDENETLASPIA